MPSKRPHYSPVRLRKLRGDLRWMIDLYRLEIVTPYTVTMLTNAVGLRLWLDAAIAAEDAAPKRRKRRKL